MKVNNIGTKVLIIYATKTGTTEDCVRLMSQSIRGSVDCTNILKDNDIDLESYQYIIFGSPLYIGKIHKKIKSFCDKYYDVLKDKSIAFVTCGLSSEQEALEYLKSSLKPELFNNLILTSHFGGELRLDRMNFLNRFFMQQLIKKNGDNHYQIDRDKVTDFCNKFNKIIGGAVSL